MLTDNGLLVFEVSYVLDTIKNKVIDYIYHEHLAYHGVKPLKTFFFNWIENAKGRKH